MTMTDLDTMPADVKLDILIAERLFGWTGIDKRWVEMGQNHATGWPAGNTSNGHSDVPQYSAEIAEAWEVVEKLRVGKFVWIKDCGGFGWRVEILSSGPTDVQIDCFAVGDTAPLAICRAALKAVL